MTREELLASARRVVWAGWMTSSEEIGSQAALSLDGVGMLVESGGAAELERFRALELGDLDGRVSASCGKPEHPTWLRKQDDTRACPWCVMELQNESLVARTHELARYQEIERDFWGDQRVDQSLAAVAKKRIAELNQERDALKARVAELEAALLLANTRLGDVEMLAEHAAGKGNDFIDTIEVLDALGLDADGNPLPSDAPVQALREPETGGA